MEVLVNIRTKPFKANLKEGISLALGFGPQAENPNCFFINDAQFEPIRVGGFVGSVQEGGSANCEVVTYCAHGNGTHTECVGHLSKERVHVVEILKDTNMLAQLVSVTLSTDEQGRSFIAASAFKNIEFSTEVQALIVRTLPNSSDKRTRNWSGNEPPYFSIEAMQHILEAGFEHLLTDLPSVDPEEDAGALAAHRIWWQYPMNIRKHATITELIYVPDSLEDDVFLLQLALPKIHSDAVPSNPILYPLSEHV